MLQLYSYVLLLLIAFGSLCLALETNKRWNKSVFSMVIYLLLSSVVYWTVKAKQRKVCWKLTRKNNTIMQTYSIIIKPMKNCCKFCLEVFICFPLYFPFPTNSNRFFFIFLFNLQIIDVSKLEKRRQWIKITSWFCVRVNRVYDFTSFVV